MTRLGILCPGQGDQTPAMFDILADEPAAQSMLDLAARLIGEDPRRFPANRLTVNATAQPTLCAYQLAVWAALSPSLPQPSVFAGYSVGELAAYGCAGTLDAETVITLAMLRALLMDGAAPRPGGLMAVTGPLRQQLLPLLDAHGCEIAIVNADDRHIVGGPQEGLQQLQADLTAQGHKTTPLPITIASHTSAMAGAVEPFQQALAESRWSRIDISVLAGLDGEAVRTKDRAIEALSRQLAQTVEWSACLDRLPELGCDIFLELGPGSGLSHMLRDRFPDLPVRSVSEFKTMTGLRRWLEAQGIDA